MLLRLKRDPEKWKPVFTRDKRLPGDDAEGKEYETPRKIRGVFLERSSFSRTRVDQFNPCTSGISWVGRICGVARFASTAGGGLAWGVPACTPVCESRGFASTAADRCGGSAAGFAAADFDAAEFTSPACEGDALGNGTAALRLAACGIEAGGRGPLLIAFSGGPTGP